MVPHKPLLSICIPTHKRAQLLRSAIMSVGPQLAEFGDDVELVISDNCSPDDTPQIVAEAMKRYPIRYHRNDSNIGAIKNVIQLGTTLAEGEYCWILGDDDFIKPGGVAKVMEVLRSHPDVDYVYVNFSHLNLDRFNEFPQPASSYDINLNLRPGNSFEENRPIERWDELIDPRVSMTFLGAIQVSVVRRKLWCEAEPLMNIGPSFTNLESTYPHIVVYANGLVGKKAYYIGESQIIVIDGARDWIGYVPIIVLVRLNEALDLYQKMGVDPSRIKRCRKALLRSCGQSFYDLFFEPTSCGRQYFQVGSFLKKYGFSIDFSMGFFYAIIVSSYRHRSLKRMVSGFWLARRRLFFSG